MDENNSFSARFKNLFPGKNLSEGSAMMGRFLSDNQTRFDGAEILKYISDGKIDELVSQAQRAKNIDELFRDYLISHRIAGADRTSFRG